MGTVPRPTLPQLLFVGLPSAKSEWSDHVSFLTLWQYEQSSPKPLNKFELNYKCETKIYKNEILKLVGCGIGLSH